MDLLEDILSLLSEKSPRTTSEIAERLSLSWHSVQESLLELQVAGKVGRIFIANRHIWFLSGDSFSEVVRRGSGGSRVTVVTNPDSIGVGGAVDE